MKRATLGVNVDHVATLREARRGSQPEIVAAALAAERAGAHGITIHLRQDRRHVQDRDVEILKRVVSTKLNLEMSLEPGILDIALATVPEQSTLVPENRQEVTTEGGLDLGRHLEAVSRAVDALRSKGVLVSLFVDPDETQLRLAADSGAQYVELHTGAYANARGREQLLEFDKLLRAASFAASLGLGVNAGHGLDYHNVLPVAGIPEVEELNIGHAIISRAVFSGLEAAVREMAGLIREAPVCMAWPY